MIPPLERERTGKAFLKRRLLKLRSVPVFPLSGSSDVTGCRVRGLTTLAWLATSNSTSDPHWRSRARNDYRKIFNKSIPKNQFRSLRKFKAITEFLSYTRRLIKIVIWGHSRVFYVVWWPMAWIRVDPFARNYGSVHPLPP